MLEQYNFLHFVDFKILSFWDVTRLSDNSSFQTKYSLTKLEKISAHNNRLNTVNNDLQKLINLTDLDLSHNNLEIIPPVISYMVSIERLNLSYNKITDFTSSSLNVYEDLDNSDASGTWGSRNLNLSPLAGKIIYIAFRHHLSAGQREIEIDDKLRTMIHDGSGEHEIEAYARTKTPSIRQDGIDMVANGITSVEEVLRVTIET